MPTDLARWLREIRFLFAVPETRLWIYISVPLGILFGIALHLRRR